MYTDADLMLYASYRSGNTRSRRIYRVIVNHNLRHAGVRLRPPGATGIGVADDGSYALERALTNRDEVAVSLRGRASEYADLLTPAGRIRDGRPGQCRHGCLRGAVRVTLRAIDRARHRGRPPRA